MSNMCSTNGCSNQAFYVSKQVDPSYAAERGSAYEWYEKDGSPSRLCQSCFNRMDVDTAQSFVRIDGVPIEYMDGGYRRDLRSGMPVKFREPGADEHWVPILPHAHANYAPGAGLRTQRSHTFDVTMPDGKIKPHTISFSEPTTVLGGHHFQRAGVSDGVQALWMCMKCKVEIAFVLDENVCPHATVVDGEVLMPEHAGQYLDLCTVADTLLVE